MSEQEGGSKAILQEDGRKEGKHGRKKRKKRKKEREKKKGRWEKRED